MYKGFVAVLVALLLGPSALGAAGKKPIRALMITGGCCHDYKNQKKILSLGISKRANVEWVIAHQGGSGTKAKLPVYESKDWAKGFDVVVHNECFAGTTDPKWIDGILKVHREGTPALLIHCAMHCYRMKSDEWFKFCGVTSHRHGAHYAYEVENLAKKNPIMAKFGDSWVTPKGELYLISKLWPTATPLGHSMSKNTKRNEVCIWTNIYNGTRVFGTTIGHHNETMEDEKYLDMITRGLLWSVDKLNDDYLVAAKKLPEFDDGPPAPSKAKPGGAKQSWVLPSKDGMVPFNHARGKKASAPKSQGGHPAEHAVDGNPQTRWCPPDNGVGYTWQVDLGKSEYVSEARVMWEQANRTYCYKVEGSNDGKAWAMLSDQSKRNDTLQIHHLKFSPKPIRYVRLTLVNVPNGAWGSFWEFEVFGAKKVKAKEQPYTSAPPQVSAGNLKSAGAGDVLKGVKVPEGFKATLFAAPPNVSYPSSVAAAPTGEVFIGVDENGSLGKDSKRNRRVIRCLDTDDDGKADKFNVFADKVGPVRGMFYHNHALWVIATPELKVYYDDDKDGVADRHKVLVTGLNDNALQKRGADHCTNGFRYAIDGWIYIAIGDFGFQKGVGSDGAELKFMGGGIVRVRPDGSELEVYCKGLRNIYDVSVDPYLNAYTRDNTNDGGGWNVRLSHIVQSGYYGYPIHFKNFSEDIIPALRDYGGGSPTGALYMQEPYFPGEYADVLYKVDWGRSIIFRHPLEADGAGFKPQPEQHEFVKISRPTDMDVDGEGRIFVTSWHNGGFSFKGDNVGFAVRVTAEDRSKVEKFPDMIKASDELLIGYLISPSAVRRQYAQLEILRRGPKSVFEKHLVGLAANDGKGLAARVAAIFTLKQLFGERSTKALVGLAQNTAVREFALRALADRKTQVANVPLEPFIKGLQDSNPRVRLAAAVGLGRLGRIEAAPALIPAVGDGDSLVSHVAINALVELNAIDACLTALDSSDSQTIDGIIRVLDGLHDSKTVDGLVNRLGSTSDPKRKLAIFRGLCRLYQKEAEWTGSWWGTRPDTRGPYYRPTKWDQSDKIGAALQHVLNSADKSVMKDMIGEVQRNRVSLSGTTSKLLAIAKSDPSFAATAVAMMSASSSIPADAIPVFEQVAKSGDSPNDLRAKAIGSLQKSSTPGATDAALRSIASYGSGKRVHRDLERARQTFVTDMRHASNIPTFDKLTKSTNESERDLAFAVLVNLANNRRAKPQTMQVAGRVVETGWETDAGTLSLINGIGFAKSKAYAYQLRLLKEDKRDSVKKAAADVYKSLRLDRKSTGPMIESMSFEKALDGAMKEKGDKRQGGELFVQLGCIACHTTSKNEPLKGPFLGGVSQKYKRPELIESILKPNAKVAQGFTSHWFEVDFEKTEGFIVRDSGDEIEVRNIQGVSTVIKKSDIGSQGKLEKSLMPDGLVNKLTVKELASLLAYLESLK